MVHAYVSPTQNCFLTIDYGFFYIDIVAGASAE